MTKKYVLLRMMVDIIFASVKGVPEYRFNILMCFITLGVFIIIYEGIMFAYDQSMKSIPLKQIMGE